jgi:hypothetical protein
LAHPEVDDKIKEILGRQRRQLDPVELLHRLREGQAALAALVSPDGSMEGPGRKTLDRFCPSCPSCGDPGRFDRHIAFIPGYHAIGEQGKIPSNQSGTTSLTGCSVIQTPQRKNSLVASRAVSARWSAQTLQRRVKEWRQMMAKLVYACMDGAVEPEIRAIGAVAANSEHYVPSKRPRSPRPIAPFLQCFKIRKAHRRRRP